MMSNTNKYKQLSDLLELIKSSSSRKKQLTRTQLLKKLEKTRKEYKDNRSKYLYLKKQEQKLQEELSKAEKYFNESKEKFINLNKQLSKLDLAGSSRMCSDNHDNISYIIDGKEYYVSDTGETILYKDYLKQQKKEKTDKDNKDINNNEDTNNLEMENSNIIDEEFMYPNLRLKE